MAGTSLFHLAAEALARTLLTTTIFEKTSTCSAGHLGTSIFHISFQGPHFPVLCPRLDRQHLQTHHLKKKMDRVSKPIDKCQILLAYGHDLTFSLCV